MADRDKKDQFVAHLEIYDLFLIYAKKRKARGARKANAWLREKLTWIMKETHINRGEFALYSHERRSWYNWLSPYTLRGGKYDLSKPCRVFRKYLTSFIKTAARVGYQFIPMLYMREQYGGRPYVNNVNDVYGYLDRSGWKFQAKILKHVARLLGRYYDDPIIKLSNEFSHHGSKEAGVEYCLWHEFMWDCIKKYVELGGVKCVLDPGRLVYPRDAALFYPRRQGVRLVDSRLNGHLLLDADFEHFVDSRADAKAQVHPERAGGGALALPDILTKLLGCLGY